MSEVGEVYRGRDIEVHFDLDICIRIGDIHVSGVRPRLAEPIAKKEDPRRPG